MTRWWERGLRVLVSASLVMGLVPSHALAEALDGAASQEAEVAVEAPPGDEVAAEEAPLEEEALADDSSEESAAEAEIAAEADSVDEESPDVSEDAAVLDEAAVTEPATDATDPLAPELEAAATVNEMTIGTSVHVDLESGENWVGKFVAPAEDTYSFWTEGSDDTYGTLYSDEALSEMLDSNDDGGEGSNFNIDYSLGEGQVVYLEAKGYSDGAASFNVSVDTRESKGSSTISDIWLYQYSYEWTGNPIHADVRVYDGNGNQLTEDVDYVLEYRREDESDPMEGSPSDFGEYWVRAVPAEGSSYTGEAGWTGMIVIGRFMALQLNTRYYELTGNPVQLDAVVTNGAGEVLVEGKDYVVEYADESDNKLDGAPSAVGTYRATIVPVEGSGYITSEAGDPSYSESFYIADLKDIGSELWTNVSYNRSIPWTGSAVSINEIHLSSYYNDFVTTLDLVEGTDFEVTGITDASGQSYESMVNPGEYSVTVGGIGTYHGSRTLTLRVYDQYDLESSAYMTFSDYDLRQGYSSPTQSSISEAYLYHGKPIEPDFIVYTTLPTYTRLVEGTDYTVTYEGNDGVGTATITLTGCGRYHGALTRSFSIIESCDLAEYAKARSVVVKVGNTTQWYDEWSNLEFVSSGHVVRPYAYFETNGYKPQLGIDYTISYLDASGAQVDGFLEAGSYTIVLSAVEGGVFTGTCNMPVNLVAAGSISSGNAVLVYEGSHWTSWAGPGGRSSHVIEDHLSEEEISRLRWSISFPYGMLVENVDFTVSYDGPTDDGGFGFTFTGIGSYTGSATSKVYVATADDAFQRHLLYGSRAYVYLDENRNVLETVMQSDTMVRGRDFVVEGVVDENGNALTSVPEGMSAYVKVAGVGDYDGCESTRYAIIQVDTGAVDLSTQNGQLTLTNGWYESTRGGFVYHLLKSLAPSVAFLFQGLDSVSLTVYEQGVLVEEGSGFSAFKRYAADGKSVEITAVADGDQLITGSTSINVKLDDSYDLASVAQRVELAGRGSMEGGGTYIVGRSTRATVPCWGFSYVPKVKLVANVGGGFVQPQYEVSVRDASGAVVPGIEGPGSYELVLSGTGDWSGEVVVPVTALQENGLNVFDCDLELGSGTKPTVTLSYGGHVFKQGTDYTVEYGNNSAEGSHAWVRVTATGNGALYGSRADSFVVYTSAPSNDLAKYGYSVWLKSQSGEYYDGKATPRAYLTSNQAAVKPEVQVRDASGNVLNASHYDVSYPNSGTSGIAVVQVTGKGDYTGTITGRYLIVATSSGATSDGWVDLGNGARGYQKNGALVKGWFDLGGYKYRFDDNGKMLTGWQTIGSAKHWFDPDTGRMAIGWTDLVIDGKTMHYYFRPSGNLAYAAWADIDGKKYYFRESGNMATGWATIDGKKYYFDEGGQMVTGWQDIVNDNGVTNHYYFRPSGSMATGWAQVDGASYYFRPSGNMATGFTDVTDDAYKRYFDEQGRMLTGWQTINGRKYYFRASGAMQTGAATIDGKSYTFSDKGVLIG